MSILSKAGLRLPAHVRDACTPLEILWRVRGVEPGVWHCPACGTIYELQHYPSDSCTGCRRPLPRRCTGVLSPTSSKVVLGCGAVVEPRSWQDERKRTHWDMPEPACRRCQADVSREQRERAFHDALPSELRSACRLSYWELPERKRWDDTVRAWVDAGCGRDRGPSALLALGPPGTGKSMALARAAHRVAVELQLVGSLMWVRERDLIDAHLDRYSPQADRAASALALLVDVRSVELLVVDEMWTSTYTPKASEEMTEIWRSRLESRKPTLAASNANDPQWARLGAHIASRWAGNGQAVRVGGIDQRRAG